MSKKILIVDDSNEFIFLIKSLLQFHKIEVDCITDPLLILEKITQNYSLIILDYNMPNKNGLELAHEIREDKEEKMPILLLTAQSFEQKTLDQLKELNLEYFKKPILPKRLVDYILRVTSE